MITEAAIQIADSEGLDAVSIRRVAAALDARAMSLYDHIEGKDELLAAMSEKVVGEALVERPLPESWREAITAVARCIYVVLASHPWLVIVFSQQPQFGPNSVKQAKQMSDALAPLGLEADEMWKVAGAVNSYVLGHSLRAATAPAEKDLEEAIPAEEMAEFSELAHLPEYLRSRSLLERFEFGLEAMLDGVEGRYLTSGGEGGRR